MDVAIFNESVSYAYLSRNFKNIIAKRYVITIIMSTPMNFISSTEIDR